MIPLKMKQQSKKHTNVTIKNHQPEFSCRKIVAHILRRLEQRELLAFQILLLACRAHRDL